MLTRRIFLRGSVITMAGAGAAPFWLARAAAGAPGRRKLVAIFLRGAADGDSNYRFHPERPITMGELARLLVAGLEIPVSITAAVLMSTSALANPFSCKWRIYVVIMS